MKFFSVILGDQTLQLTRGQRRSRNLTSAITARLLALFYL